MPEMHLNQPGFTYTAYGPFTKNKERIENTDFIYRNDFDKACFQQWHGLWWIKRFNKMNSIRKSFDRWSFWNCKFQNRMVVKED